MKVHELVTQLQLMNPNSKVLLDNDVELNHVFVSGPRAQPYNGTTVHLRSEHPAGERTANVLDRSDDDLCFTCGNTYEFHQENNIQDNLGRPAGHEFTSMRPCAACSTPQMLHVTSNPACSVHPWQPTIEAYEAWLKEFHNFNDPGLMNQQKG